MHIEEADFLLENYNFDLPQEQIAQFPPEERGSSRLLVMPRKGALDLHHKMFSDLPDCLPEGALLIANNSRVLQARLLGTRSTGGKVEFLLLTPLPLVVERAKADKSGGFFAEAEGLVRSGGSIREGETFDFGAGIRVGFGVGLTDRGIGLTGRCRRLAGSTGSGAFCRRGGSRI